ncbi:MAG TPA: hypothetical protein VGP07_15540 [Polyangia bacterium]
MTSGPASTGGGGGVTLRPTGTGGMVGSGGNRGEGLGPELCSLAVRCTDGKVSGIFGNSCDPIAFDCPLGCDPDASVPQVGVGASSETAMRAAEQLCNQPKDGSIADGSDACETSGGGAGGGITCGGGAAGHDEGGTGGEPSSSR